jgi:hypothetical protein
VVQILAKLFTVLTEGFRCFPQHIYLVAEIVSRDTHVCFLPNRHDSTLHNYGTALWKINKTTNW